MAIEELPLAVEQAAEAPPPQRRERGLWRDAFRQTFRKRSAVVGAVILAAAAVHGACSRRCWRPYGERRS